MASIDKSNRPVAPEPTIDRLRFDIDHGRTGDKVNYPDPALAPLGTDAEAAGHPPSQAEIGLEARALPQGPAPRNPESRGFLLYVTLLIAVGAVLIGLSAGLTAILS